MRTLFAALTQADFDLPVHCVITRLHYDSLPGEISQCGVIDRTRKKITVDIADQTGFLTVDLRPLKYGLVVRSESRGNGGPLTMEFTAGDILRFVEDVGDMNPIHRNAPYVVPAFLILEFLWRCVKDHKGAKRISIYYHRPVIAGDKVTLTESGGPHQIEGYVGGRIAFSARYYKDHGGPVPVNEACIN